MNTALIPILFACAALAGCSGEDTPAKPNTTRADAPVVAAPAPKPNIRPTPDTLSDDELAKIVAQCQKNGTIVTDDYCKQCSYVLEKRLYNQAEAARRARNEASGREAAKKSESRSPDMFQR